MYKIQEDLVQKKIDEITAYLLSAPKNDVPSLFGDIAGRVIFMFYYGYIYNDKSFSNKAKEHLIRIFDIINNTNNLYIHFADGITGIQTMLILLMSDGFISDTDFDVGDEIDDVLFQHTKHEIESYSDDFFYGYLGILYYYVIKYKYRQTLDLYSKIDAIIDAIYAREFSGDDYKHKYIDLGIPHGFGSMIIILSEIFELKINQYKTKRILDKLYSYYKPFIQEKKGYSFFPTIFEKGHTEQYIHSRLGWCYGDVSCVLALLRYSECMDNKELHDECINILIDTCYRKNLNYNIIRDSCFCHGSAGLAYIYLYLYKKYKVNIFYNAHKYWLDNIFCFANHVSDGAAGFAAYVGDGYKKSDDILSGIVGIGLVLISSITMKRYSWERLFLL